MQCERYKSADEELAITDLKIYKKIFTILQKRRRIICSKLREESKDGKTSLTRELVVLPKVLEAESESQESFIVKEKVFKLQESPKIKKMNLITN